MTSLRGSGNAHPSSGSVLDGLIEGSSLLLASYINHYVMVKIPGALQFCSNLIFLCDFRNMLHSSLVSNISLHHVSHLSDIHIQRIPRYRVSPVLLQTGINIQNGQRPFFFVSHAVPGCISSLPVRISRYKRYARVSAPRTRMTPCPPTPRRPSPPPNELRN